MIDSSIGEIEDMHSQIIFKKIILTAFKMTYKLNHSAFWGCFRVNSLESCELKAD